MKTYQAIASKIQAMENCRKSGNDEWLQRHSETLDKLMESAPNGSGFDCGTKLREQSTSERLIFAVSFHHMSDGGFYDGWTEHSVIVTPSLQFGFSVRITGRDRNDIKEYIGEVFDTWLNSETE